MTGGSVGVASKSGLGFCEKKLFSMGLDLQKKNGYYYIVPKRVLYTEIMTGAYPLFPTDIAPVFAPILARYGGGKITEGVWYNRFGYLDALNEFGIRSRRFSHGCEIYPSNIHPATVDACDLRAGAAMLLSALFARGISTVSSANIIKRGYSGINDKLLCLGAKIKNIKE
jgi:UDP-N-acetylglucosamine 1-carboxyvinyltransferase